MSSGNFNPDDMFAALGIATPNLIFECNSAGDTDTWNVKLPGYKTHLVGQNHPDLENGILNPNLRHYQGVIRENCKRLLRGTATACSQAGAIFRVRGTFHPGEPVDFVSEWIAECSSVPIIAIEPLEAFHPDIIRSLLDNSHNYNPNASAEDEEEARRIIKLNNETFFSGESEVNMHTGTPTNSCPQVRLTHLILTDDKNLLDDLLEIIPSGLIVVNGGNITTRMFCDAVQKANPIFLFKYTGSTADLACETLTKVDQWLAKKRKHPTCRPEQPFKTDLPKGYSHFRW